MNLGFKELDKIINVEEPQLILLTGTHFIEELSRRYCKQCMFKTRM